MRDDRGGREAAAGIDHCGNAIRRQNLQRHLERRLRQGMGIAAHVKRPVDALCGAIMANRLGDGGDVIFIEGGVE